MGKGREACAFSRGALGALAAQGSSNTLRSETGSRGQQERVAVGAGSGGQWGSRSRGQWKHNRQHDCGCFSFPPAVRKQRSRLQPRKPSGKFTQSLVGFVLWPPQTQQAGGDHQNLSDLLGKPRHPGSCLHKVGGHGQRDSGKWGSAQSMASQEGRDKGVGLTSFPSFPPQPPATTAITQQEQQPWMK